MTESDQATLGIGWPRLQLLDMRSIVSIIPAFKTYPVVNVESPQSKRSPLKLKVEQIKAEVKPSAPLSVRAKFQFPDLFS